MSGIWGDYFHDDGEEDTQEEEPEPDRRTRLDKTIDRIGMGEIPGISLF
jgi:hypothetical protein